MDLIIDSDLRTYLDSDGIPKECTELLEKDLIENGIRDKIVVWKRRGVILDGHRRYEIAKKHNLKFDVHYLDFETFPECKEWMDLNQNMRRNQDPNTIKEYLSSLYKKKVKSGVKKEKALDEVASQAGVSTRTVRRANDHQEAMSAIAKPVKEKVKALKAKTRDIEELAELPEELQEDVIRQVESGEFKTLGEALRGEGEQETAKDRAKLFKEAVKNLGILAKSIDHLKGEGEVQYAECRRYVTAIGEALRKWE